MANPEHTNPEGSPVQGDSDKTVWEPIAGTRLYSRNGIGRYERLKDDLFLRVDELDPSGIVERFHAATSNENFTSADEAQAEGEATEILARVDRELMVEEALTQRLLQRYGLAV